jgi:hypothetical protein
MASTPTSLDTTTSAILDIASRLRGLDATSEKSAEVLFRIGKGFETFEKLDVRSLTSNVSSLQMASGSLTALGDTLRDSIRWTGSFAAYGKTFGEALTGLSEGLKNFSKLSISDIKTNLDLFDRSFVISLRKFIHNLEFTVGEQFNRLGETVGRPLLELSRGLKEFSELSVSDVRYNLTKIANEFDDIIEEFGIYFSGITDKEFKKLSEDFGKPLLSISEGLIKFSEISVLGVKQNLEDLFFSFSDIITFFGNVFRGSTDKEFKKLSEDFGKPLVDISEGLSKFGDLSVLDIDYNLNQFKLSINDIVKTFRELFTSKTDKEFNKLGQDFGKPLVDISEGLSKFSDLSIPSIRNNLKNLANFIPDIIGDFRTLFKSKTDKEFRKLGQDFGKPLVDISNGLKVFSDLSIFEIKKNILLLKFLPGSFKTLAEELSAAGPSLKNVGKTFGAPLKQIADALKSFSELSVVDLMITVHLLSLSKMFNTLEDLVNNFKYVTPDLKDLGKTFGEPLKKIGDGLKAFGDLSWIDIIFSATMLKGFTFLLSFSIKALSKMSRMMDSAVTTIVKLGDALNVLSRSIASSMVEFFYILGKDLKKIGKGTVALTMMSAAFAVFGNALKNFSGIDIAAVTVGTLALMGLNQVIKNLNSSMKGVLALTLLAAGMGLFGKALQQFTNIDFKQVAIGVGIMTALGIAAKFLDLKGIAALTLMGGALFLSAKAFQLFSDVKWGGVLIGAGALTVLTAAMFGLGALVSGPQGLLFIAGIAALTGLGVSLLPAAFAFKMLGEGAEGVASALSQITPQLSELAQIGPALFNTATALGVLSAALVAFSAGSLFSGGAGLFGKILGINPIDRLKELAALGDGLEKTATSLERINASRSNTGEQLEGVKYDNMNRQSVMQSEKQLAGLTPGSNTTISNVGGSTINNTNVNANNIPDRTTYVLAGNMAWNAC